MLQVNGKSHYVDRRRSIRIKLKDSMKRSVLIKNIRKKAGIINMSYHGALLKMRSMLNLNDIVMLSIHFPFESRPVNIKARVVRTVSTIGLLGFTSYKTGVEFLNSDNIRGECFGMAIKITLAFAAI